ncbi:MAG: type II secretion system protein [Candidatus Paceibacterota bacterium]
MKLPKSKTTHYSLPTNHSSGFTLVETIVAVFIFTIVMTVAAGAILNIISVSRKAQSLSSVINNLNLAIDTMSRDIRFGTEYVGNRCVDSICQEIRFVNKDGAETSYYSDNKQLFKKTTVSGAVNTSVVTAKEVLLERMDFYLTDATGLIPRVLFVGKGEVVSKGVVLSSFDIQTTVTHRTI